VTRSASAANKLLSYSAAASQAKQKQGLDCCRLNDLCSWTDFAHFILKF